MAEEQELMERVLREGILAEEISEHLTCKLEVKNENGKHEVSHEVRYLSGIDLRKKSPLLGRRGATWFYGVDSLSTLFGKPTRTHGEDGEEDAGMLLYHAWIMEIPFEELSKHVIIYMDNVLDMRRVMADFSTGSLTDRYARLRHSILLNCSFPENKE